MRLTTFNVENLFARPRVFHRGDWDEGKDLLDAYAKTSALLEETTYTPAIKERIVQGLRDLKLASSDSNKFVRLRQNRGRLVTGGVRTEGRGRRPCRLGRLARTRDEAVE